MRRIEDIEVGRSGERSLLRMMGLVAGLALVLAVAGCSNVREHVGPLAPTSIDTSLHGLPNGAQVRSFDSVTCDVATNSFTSGTEVCAKPTGLGNGFVGTLEWIRPDSTIARTTNIVTNGSYQDRFTPDACGTWTLRLTHPTTGAPDVMTWSFEVTDCVAQACSPGFWRQDRNDGDYATAMAALLLAIGGSDSFNGIFGLTQAQTGLPDSYTLADALDDPGNNSPGPNPNNANFVGAGAILSAAHPDVAYPYTIAEVIAAVRGAYGIGAPDPDLADLDNTFETGHICPLDSSGQ